MSIMLKERINLDSFGRNVKWGALCSYNKNLFVVGDPDQSIYEFIGADPNLLIKTFIEDFSETKKQENVRLYDDNGKFIGIYTYVEEAAVYKPVKLFVD